MLTTSTTERGALVIRSEDLRRLEDTPEGCMLCFVEEGQRTYTTILGTAAENRDRIIAEEGRALAVYEEMQARTRQGYGALPVVRGGKAGAR